MLHYVSGSPGSSDGKESVHNVGDPGLTPRLGGFPGEGTGYPLKYSCLENSTDRGPWKAPDHGVAKSREWLIAKNTIYLNKCKTTKESTELCYHENLSYKSLETKITDIVTKYNAFFISALQILSHLSTFKCLLFCDASHGWPEGLTHFLCLYFLLQSLNSFEVLRVFWHFCLNTKLQMLREQEPYNLPDW